MAWQILMWKKNKGKILKIGKSTSESLQTFGIREQTKNKSPKLVSWHIVKWMRCMLFFTLLSYKKCMFQRFLVLTFRCIVVAILSWLKPVITQVLHAKQEYVVLNGKSSTCSHLLVIVWNLIHLHLIPFDFGLHNCL
jgi:hypothetical protein